MGTDKKQLWTAKQHKCRPTTINNNKQHLRIINTSKQQVKNAVNTVDEARRMYEKDRETLGEFPQCCLLLPVVVIVACRSLPLCIAVRCSLWPFAGLYCCLLLPLLFIVVSSSSSDLRRGPLTGARCSGSAIKHEEVDQPRLQEYIEVTANTYSPGDLLGVGSWAAAVTEKK